jgi:hypothetical protein
MVPVSGSISDPQFRLRRVMSSAVRSAIARLIRNPFRAISRSLRDTDTIEVPTVDPVTFAPGSSVIDPEMEQHLLRVADVLRRKPFVNLALAPAPGSGDVEVLKAETLSMKLGASLLREREPTPEGLLSELSQRRVDATRQQLTSVEGIPAGRLVIAAPTLDVVSPSAGQGRVELSVVAGE